MTIDDGLGIGPLPEIGGLDPLMAPEEKAEIEVGELVNPADLDAPDDLQIEVRELVGTTQPHLATKVAAAVFGGALLGAGEVTAVVLRLAFAMVFVGFVAGTAKIGDEYEPISKIGHWSALLCGATFSRLGAAILRKGGFDSANPAVSKWLADNLKPGTEKMALGVVGAPLFFLGEHLVGKPLIKIGDKIAEKLGANPDLKTDDDTEVKQPET